ncbi:hypothetical protein OF83DRAFT_1175740 [Amylostereum chailletii]|nr:hypothetical protein OF83DRAFT_1175740 [Amylostereum chailletii]
MPDVYPDFAGNSTFLGGDDVFSLGFYMELYEPDLRNAIRPLLAETAMFGVFSLLFFLAVCVFVRKNLRHVTNVLMLSAVVVLYTGAALHWVLQVLLVEAYGNLTDQMTSYTSSCLFDLSEGGLCRRVLPDSLMDLLD